MKLDSNRGIKLQYLFLNGFICGRFSTPFDAEIWQSELEILAHDEFSSKD
jgi:hypothetical protein